MLRTTYAIVIGGLALPACLDLPEQSTATSAVMRDGPIGNFIGVKSSGLCLVGPAVGNGPVTQGTCLSAQTRWWKIVEKDNDPGFFWIEQEVGGSHRCLDVPAGSGQGAAVNAFTCHRLDTQLFRFSRTVAGEWKIRPKLGSQSNLCLDVAFGDAVVGRPLQLFPCKTTGFDNQRFLTHPQLRPPEYVSCGDSDFIRIESSDGNRTMNPGAIVNFDAGSFRYGCEDMDADELHQCPTGTDLIELNFNHSDKFRVRCALN